MTYEEFMCQYFIFENEKEAYARTCRERKINETPVDLIFMIMFALIWMRMVRSLKSCRKARRKDFRKR